MGREKKEEDIDVLLSDYSRNVSGKSSVVFFGMALIISCTPIWLYWRLFYMEPKENAIIYAVVSIAVTFVISYAYKNTKFVMKHKVAVRCESAVSKEINKLYSGDKNMTKQEKEERIHWKKNEVAEIQGVSFSLFYVNLLFLFSLSFSAFVLLPAFTPVYNYVASMAISAALVALISTSNN